MPRIFYSNIQKFALAILFVFVFSLVPFTYSSVGLEKSVVRAESKEVKQARQFTVMPTDKSGKMITFCLNKKTSKPEFTLCDLLYLGVRIGSIILYLVGSVVMLMIVVASVIFITAQGHSEKIQQGRKVLRAAVTGLIIVLLAYEVVGVIYSSFLKEGSVTDPTKTTMGKTWNYGWWDFDKFFIECQKITCGSTSIRSDLLKVNSAALKSLGVGK